MAKDEITYAHDRTREFLRAYIESGAHQLKPAKYSEDRWIQRRNIVGSYFCSLATTDDLGRVYGNVTGERIRQIIKESICFMHGQCPPDVQDQFPLPSIPLDKKLSIQSRGRNSLTHGGKLYRVVQAIKAGLPIEQIKEQENMTDSDFSSLRNRAKAWGVEIAYKRRTAEDNRQLAAALRRERDPAKIQDLYRQVTGRFLFTHSRGEDAILIPLTKAIREASFYFDARQFATFVNTIKESQIPYGVVIRVVQSGPQKGEYPYYFIASHQQPVLQQALVRDPKLEKYQNNPVIQIACAERAIPNTAQIIQRNGYKSIYQLLEEMDFNLPRGYRFEDSDLYDPNCPVPLYRYRTTVSYSRDDEAALRKFLFQKVQSS